MVCVNVGILRLKDVKVIDGSINSVCSIPNSKDRFIALAAILFKIVGEISLLSQNTPGREITAKNAM